MVAPVLLTAVVFAFVVDDAAAAGAGDESAAAEEAAFGFSAAAFCLARSTMGFTVPYTAGFRSLMAVWKGSGPI